MLPLLGFLALLFISKSLTARAFLVSIKPLDLVTTAVGSLFLSTCITVGFFRTSSMSSTMSVISTGSEGVSYLLISFCCEVVELIGGLAALGVVPDPVLPEL